MKPYQENIRSDPSLAPENNHSVNTAPTKLIKGMLTIAERRQ